MCLLHLLHFQNSLFPLFLIWKTSQCVFLMLKHEFSVFGNHRIGKFPDIKTFLLFVNCSKVDKEWHQEGQNYMGKRNQSYGSPCFWVQLPSWVLKPNTIQIADSCNVLFNQNFDTVFCIRSIPQNIFYEKKNIIDNGKNILENMKNIPEHCDLLHTSQTK